VVGEPGEPLFIVLGMHRSGTSALSGLLAAAGARPPVHQLTPDPTNPRGYFESARILAVNGARLSGNGSAWDDPLLFPCPEWPRPEDLRWRAAAREAFEAEFAGAARPMMKDPRLSVLLPAWRPVFAELGAQPRCAISVRRPAAVAASLVRRDGFSAEKALLLWVSYMTAAVLNSDGLPRVFVSYDALVADWRGEADRIEAALGLPSPARDPARAQEADEFLSPELRRNAGGGDVTRYGWAGEAAARLYQTLEAAASGEAPDPDVVASVADLLRAKRAEFGPIVASMSRDLDRARAEIRRLRQLAGSGAAAAHPAPA
jgi:hypothetical protein